jgi:hypothetical protein
MRVGAETAAVNGEAGTQGSGRGSCCPGPLGHGVPRFLLLRGGCYLSAARAASMAWNTSSLEMSRWVTARTVVGPSTLKRTP